MTKLIFAAICLAGLSVGCMSNQQGLVEAEEVGDLSLGEAQHEPYNADLDAACGEHGYDATAFQRLPYVQDVRTDSARLLGVSDDTALSVRVTSPAGDEIDLAPAAVDTTAQPIAGTQWEATLVNLEPNAIYCYEVLDSDGVSLANAAFKTAPGSGTAIRFAAMGDLGTDSGDALAVLEQLENVELDFVVLAGDIAYTDGTRSQVENNFFAVYNEMLLNIPFYAAIGNHDANTENAAPLLEAFALPENGGAAGRERWYSYDWGDLHVVVLDSESDYAPQADWLDADLAAAADQPWKIAVLHRPPYSSGSHGSNTSVRSAFTPLFEKYGVQMVFTGHDHHYERTNDMNGVTYVVTGGGGIGTRPVGSSSFTAFAQQVAHFTYVVIEDGEMKMYAIDGTGQTFDTYKVAR